MDEEVVKLSIIMSNNVYIFSEIKSMIGKHFREGIEKTREELYCNDRYSFDDVCYTYYVCPDCMEDMIAITMLPVIDKEKACAKDVLETQKIVLENILYADYDFLHEIFYCECNSEYQLKRIIYCYFNNNIDYHNYIEFPFDSGVTTYNFEYKNITTNKYILFFDTETTGLPLNWNASFEDIENWPRLVQIAWILSDEKGTIKSEKSFIIKPNDFFISSESTKIHGITHNDAIRKGISLDKVLDEFGFILNHADYLVAHNMKYDFNVIASEFYRLNRPSNITKLRRICTMESTTDFCKLPDFKYPKLSELYSILFNESFSNAHNAAYDVKAVYKCFYKLVNLNIIKPN